jgi:hypothetical protein
MISYGHGFLVNRRARAVTAVISLVCIPLTSMTHRLAKEKPLRGDVNRYEYEVLKAYVSRMVLVYGLRKN